MDFQFSLHNVIACVFGSRHHHVIQCEAFALPDCVGYVFVIRLRVGGLCGDFERGVGESVIEVIAENPLAIVGQFLFGVGLSRLRAQFGQVFRRELFIAHHVDLTHLRPRPLFDVNMHGKSVLQPLEVVVDFGLDLDLAKSIRPI